MLGLVLLGFPFQNHDSLPLSRRNIQRTKANLTPPQYQLLPSNDGSKSWSILDSFFSHFPHPLSDVILNLSTSLITTTTAITPGYPTTASLWDIFGVSLHQLLSTTCLFATQQPDASFSGRVARKARVNITISLSKYIRAGILKQLLPHCVASGRQAI